MRSPRSTFRERLAVVAFVALAPRTSFAQACCAAANALGTARLALHEDALVGVSFRAAPAFGSFDAGGTYRGSPSGSAEVGLEEDLLGAVRIFDSGQLSVAVPLVETWREASGASEASAGIGDLHVGARWDFMLAGEHATWPGLGLTADVLLPTGTAADDAKKRLATDATGIGAARVALGLSVEQVFGPVLAALNGALSKRFDRRVGEVSEQTALEWSLGAAVGLVTSGGSAVALTASASGQGDSTIDGASTPGSARRTTALGVSGGTPIGDTWRVQANLQALPPISGLSENQAGTLSLGGTVLHTW